MRPWMITPAALVRPGALWLKVLRIVWLVAVIAACIAVARYKSTPGADSSSPLVWPEESALPRDPDQAQVLMFVHPRCPCTRASLAELHAIVAQHPRLAAVTLVLMKPWDSGPDWLEGDVPKSAAEIPGAAVVIDEDGGEAARFGARTSGRVVAYDADGRRVFDGGITDSRGHVGESTGGMALVAALSGARPGTTAYPTFGCGLFETLPELAP